MTVQPNDVRSKCQFCGAETIGSDVCHKCLDNPERQKFFETLKESRLGKLEEKTYQPYSFFCEDQENETEFKPAAVAEYLASPEIEHFKTDVKTDILYYGDVAKGVWLQDGEAILKAITAKILGKENKISHYNNILHHLKSITQTEIVFSEKIAVENGLLDIETLQLSPYSLDIMTYYQIETAYHPAADCPQFKAFLQDVLPDEKDRLLLQEWSGYLLLPDYRFHKLLWVHGAGRNGKGVWQRTMEAIIGEKNVSSVGLEEFDGNHRFAIRQLYGKLFNPCSEPTTNRILQTALLKKATGQDTISAECKGKDKRIEFRNCAKITVIANKFPKVRDTTTAFSERRLFITFPKEFIGKLCIVNIEKNWLDDPMERMGILNWMFEGLHRLLSNGCFTESKSQEETELEFERHSDTIQAFLKEMVIFNKNLAITRTDAYTAYKEYCDLFGLDNESDKKFTQRLKETPKITVGTLPPKNLRSWKGIGLKKINEDGTITDQTHLTDLRGLYPLNNLPNQNIEEGIEGVKSVKPVKDQLCKDVCRNFNTQSCTANNPEQRSLEAVKPLKCPGFRDIREQQYGEPS